MKKAFTIIELLVVIAIIGILAGILIASFGGGTESARAAKCLTNMRALAQGCLSAGAADTDWRRMPAAGSHEYMTPDISGSQPRVVYGELKGWVSWYSKGAYVNKPNTHKANASMMTSMYSTDDEQNMFCLTNGALWKFVGGNKKVYVCPNHAKYKGLKRDPAWSYVMNAAFGWDYSKGSRTIGDNRRVMGSVNRADKVLLFAEIPYRGIGSWQPDGEGSGTDCDCVLQYNGSLIGDTSAYASGSENIGVNHKSGKNLFAHVAFADGHAEKLNIPYSGNIKKPSVDDGQLRQLTAWLCTGTDVTLTGGRYQKVDQ